ncbi:MAG: Gfo/Idh/MocA family oxidoreductase [Paracoccaceae bacterium]
MSRFRMGVVGIDHRHIYTMVQHMQHAGGELVGWWTDGAPGTLDGFIERFGKDGRVHDADQLFDNSQIDIILTAAIPSDRPAIAIRAMQSGKDVLSDKPGCLTNEDLINLRATQAATQRIWSVDFSERFEVPAVTLASEMVAAGEIGQVIQTLGIGPHRLNAPTRPDWFWDRTKNGGILADIGSHQIDQFLHLTGSTDAEIVSASVDCILSPPFQDFGQITLKSGQAHGYVRLDWFTPDALPTWGDGRLFVLGTKGSIELRKYVDIGGPSGTDHVLLVNGTRLERFDAAKAGLPFFSRLVNDILERTETAMPQAHPFTVTKLAIAAQAMAESVC